MPMAYPGVMKQGTKWLFDKQGPVRLSLRQLPANLAWFYQFFRTSQSSNWAATYEALHAINAPCVALYAEMLGQSSWERVSKASGALHVWRNKFQGPLDMEVARLRDAYSVPYEHVNAGEIADLEPSLSRDFKRGIFFPGSGYVVSSVGLVESLMAEACSRGASFQNAQVKQVIPLSRGFRIDGDPARREFDAVVLAAGYATRDLARNVGIKLSMASERGYHVTLPEIEHGVTRPVTDAESAIVATPVSEGLRIVGIADFDFANAAFDDTQAEKLLARATQMFPALKPMTISKWMGVRPSMPDSLPVIDRHPQMRDLIFATGHGHMGISGAPMTAALVSDLIAERKPRISLDRYRVR